MIKEQSVGAIIFYIEGTVPHYLLLKYPGSKHIRAIDGSPVPAYWEFPKGHVEGDEQEQDTLGRELREETGITDVELHKSFREVIEYDFVRGHEMIHKQVVFYLLQVRSNEVRTSHEHLSHQWLPYGQAHQITPFRKSKEVLQKANEFVENHLEQLK